jgi:hypothetical protein
MLFGSRSRFAWLPVAVPATLPVTVPEVAAPVAPDPRLRSSTGAPVSVVGVVPQAASKLANKVLINSFWTDACMLTS